MKRSLTMAFVSAKLAAARPRSSAFNFQSKIFLLTGTFEDGNVLTIMTAVRMPDILNV